MDKQYYIGIDLGSNSVGWATSDADYNLLRLNGKTAFGARLFDEAKSSAERRKYRSNRRRIARRKYRIYLLNQLFAEEINKVDSTFFARLANSTYHLEDKSVNTENIIFKTRAEEIDFYKSYPTIWHLRKALCENDEKALSDIRNIYMAIHHIIKYRGNFLKEGEYNNSFDMEVFEKLNESLKKAKAKDEEIDIDDIDFDAIEKDNYNKILDELKNDDHNKITKKSTLKKLFNTTELQNEKEYIELIVTIICGGEYKLNKIIDDSTLSICFGKSYEDNVDSLKNEMGEDFEIVELCKDIYDYIQLNKLLGADKYLSDAMIRVHDNHKNDIKTLKKVIIQIDEKKNNNHALYTEVFKSKDISNNYQSFIKGYIDKGKCSIEEFNKYIISILNNNKEFIDNETFNSIIGKCEKNEFLLTPSIESTSLIPHQLHLIELNKIIENASVKYPFILQIKDKLIKIFKFKVEYYYGPLRGEYSNVERKNDGKIYPWNINEIVDDEKTKVNFMKKLTNTCSYLLDCKVLPKASLIIEKFLILDRLNVMQINGQPISFNDKQKLYQFIISHSKTTISKLKEYLSNLYGTKEIILGKINEDIPFEAPSHFKLQKEFDINKDVVMLERVIFLSTCFADDKNKLHEIIQKEFPDLSPRKINVLCNIQTSKWARLSKELLTDIFYINDIGEAKSILQLMEETNKNFQMILNDKTYNFNKLINDHNKEAKGEVSKQTLVNEILDSTPALVRRSINQTLLIIDDVKKYAGNDPEKIFVEVTRENNDENKRKLLTKNSRKKEINYFINSLKKDAKEYNDQISKVEEELNNEELVNDINLKSKHIYLYFKQLGMDVYTGEKININDVLNSDKYDIDHIIPQSLIKDDSLDNRVLVERTINQKVKQDIYPIPYEIKTEKVLKLWKFLYHKGLISEKKYNNLMRNSEISLEEIETFVNRQINVVDYANISLKNILEIKFPNTKIIFSKAQYPHYLREKMSIVKNRNLNDAHHAVDAYLNIIAGNVLSTTFSNVRYIYEEKSNKENRTFNMETVLDRKVINNKDINDKILKNCLRHDALVTYKHEYSNGSFYKQTIYKANEGNNLIPIHTKGPMQNTNKYGGYTSFASSGLILIEYKKGDKLYKAIDAKKVMLDKQNLSEKEYLIRLNKDYENGKIIRDIPLNAKVEYDGGIYYIYSSNEGHNKLKMAYQNYISNESLLYLDIALKHINEIDEDKDDQELIFNRKNIHSLLVSKEINNNIFKELILNCNKKIYDSCNYICKVRDNAEFNNKTLKDQLFILNELIVALSRTSEQSRLKNFIDVGNMKLLVTKNITNNKVYLIEESPSGLYRHKVKL